MTFDREEFHTLCESAIENRADREQLERLERLVVENAEARRYYVESVYQHLDLLDAHLRDTPSAAPPEIRRKRRSFPYRLAGAAVVLLLLVVSWIVPSKPGGDERTETGTASFALVHELGGDCLWDDDIRGGQRIGKSELRLNRGIAQLRFDNGVLVTLEAPVRLSVLSRDRCFLHSGKVLARVSPEGTGFVIDTPKAMIEDLGTEFGIQVQEGREAEVRVFSGRVDVHQRQNEVIPLETGRRIRFSGRDDAPFNPNVDVAGKAASLSENEILCSTADGRGKEACVLSGGDYRSLGSSVSGESDVYILVKNSGGADNPWNRKGYFSIDLSGVPSKPLEHAQLELTFGPAGVGFESRTSEVSRFSVYGIVDQEKDAWTPESITWENAPANLPGGNDVDLTQVILIGQFEIEREEQSGVRVLSGMALQQFLEADTNNLATFVIVCDTREPVGMGIAYGFANRNHPDLPPPTLRLVPAPDVRQ